ncbi:hypothetical protein EI42_03155 [Thermosporothrix hazakensis]|uniref:Uncharacterized protein n=1 Tax=Thermosporothrix hazakensis TaxID=644383 RepID=A0A326U708_THEHA|nr:hypothetical protein [Thermosporothrix hazakensis]PZW28401.1 hypothetical protein EI42_03155 [Thermosporothrix hazakensis]GCE45181.1 hypothetical protein KTH_00500 [Thermosporothrix hazakensis]
MILRLEIDDPGDLFQVDFEATIKRELHQGTDNLRDLLLGRIVDRTPHLKGALQRDETGKFNTDPADPLLVAMYTESDDQMQWWGRVYDIYVEGGPLGDNSPTITRPARMFWQGGEKDIPAIEDWAAGRLEIAAMAIASGKGER